MQRGFNTAILPTNGQGRLGHENQREPNCTEERNHGYYQELEIEEDERINLSSDNEEQEEGSNDENLVRSRSPT